SWGAQQVGGITIASAPALAAFKGNLYCAFEDNVTHALGVIRAPDGQNWTSASNGISASAVGSRPALAAFNGRLYCGYRDNDAPHSLCLTSSVDGANWEQPHRYDELHVPLSAVGGPTLCAVGKTLYALLSTSDGTRNPVCLCAADA